ncbi:LPS export ABC transporter periplasmic protein LptC [Leadbettera azotonutricia]|uniref:Putative lipoprotein n=1 Tax=Leadbettera azotonutricia (strain ATCC BAA-888 / DSM 13862 / ZAS-9) TaxID=545695 RepID=F5YFQ8_LEAAZ|nr:LPS export ABC transporter periplasmic protein LptC [Leadbettera azotonutricia]AEF80187.1 putative lipoprotein [Leadbettera azotonutricia ZAS-9]
MSLKPKSLLKFFIFPLQILTLLLVSCSFDYGNNQLASKDQPDIVMQNVEYVRVRGGDPVVRFHAEDAERFEERQIMNLRNFSFEQFENHGDDIDAMGRAGQASVALDSGNINLGGGVIISVESEDITIETSGLDWQDKERRLLGTPSGDVNISRSDGTEFSGRGFSADARSRTWTFTSGVSGSYVEKEEKEAEEEGDNYP